MYRIHLQWEGLALHLQCPFPAHCQAPAYYPSLMAVLVLPSWSSCLHAPLLKPCWINCSMLACVLINCIWVELISKNISIERKMLQLLNAVAPDVFRSQSPLQSQGRPIAQVFVLSLDY
jgi:hypothetical protein